ncbi:acyltransferase [Inquilinus sp. KBS0705]|nr:acyltransferase [Inquilinus sp. KBS0705]
MIEYITQKTADKKNAFDLLRLLLAISVLITHALLLGGYKLYDPLHTLSKGQTNLAELGVMGFFTLSGYLISASFERSANPAVFASHRLLRILPAYWVCLVLTAFVFAPIIYSIKDRHVADYFANNSGSAINYVWKNFFLKINQWSIAGVLDFASYKDSLNGSLWSLYPEMQCYCFTLLAGVFGLLKKNSIPYLIISITVFAFFAIGFNFSKGFGPTILLLSPAFKLYISYVAGSLIYVFRDKLIFNKMETIFIAGFSLLLIKFGGFHLLSPLLIALTLINVFQLFSFRLKYDISYGIYIYSFIVEQLLYQIFGNSLPVVAFIGIALVISVILGWASHLLVEKPFINLKKTTDVLLIRSINSNKSK